MKNGKIYEGKIINQTREKIQVELDNKQVLVLDKKDIKKIRYTPSKEELERKRREEERQKELLRQQEELERKRKEERQKELLRQQEELERKRKEEKKQQTALVPPKKPLISRQNFGISFGIGPSSYRHAFIDLLNFYSLYLTYQIFYVAQNLGGGQFTSFLSSPMNTSTNHISMQLFTHIDEVSFYLSFTSFSLNPVIKNLILSEYLYTGNMQYLDIDPFITARKTNPISNTFNFYLNFIIDKNELLNTFLFIGIPLGLKMEDSNLISPNDSISFSSTQNRNPTLTGSNWRFRNRSITLWSGVNLEWLTSKNSKIITLISYEIGESFSTFNKNKLGSTSPLIGYDFDVSNMLTLGLGLGIELQYFASKNFVVFLNLNSTFKTSIITDVNNKLYGFIYRENGGQIRQFIQLENFAKDIVFNQISQFFTNRLLIDSQSLNFSFGVQSMIDF
ncbi:MAG: hypothetical protein RMI35_06180 [Leptospiraceae bacterium]|nr:hypothetical protein [Leptospiraceae bacterium]